MDPLRLGAGVRAQNFRSDTVKTFFLPQAWISATLSCVTFVPTLRSKAPSLYRTLFYFNAYQLIIKKCSCPNSSRASELFFWCSLLTLLIFPEKRYFVYWLIYQNSGSFCHSRLVFPPYTRVRKFRTSLLLVQSKRSIPSSLQSRQRATWSNCKRSLPYGNSIFPHVIISFNT